MATTASNRTPVCNADGVIIERVDRSRLSRVIVAPNATVISKGIRKGGGVVRVMLNDVGDDSLEDSKHRNARVLSHDRETNSNPPRCWTLKRIPSSTRDIFRAVVLDRAA